MMMKKMNRKGINQGLCCMSEGFSLNSFMAQLAATQHQISELHLVG